VVCAALFYGKIRAALMDCDCGEEFECMHELYTYQIEVRGRIDENTFNAGSPTRVKVVEAGTATSLLQAYADQSGLIGLIRHVHQQGYQLLSVTLVRSMEDKSR